MGSLALYCRDYCVMLACSIYWETYRRNFVRAKYFVCRCTHAMRTSLLSRSSCLVANLFMFVFILLATILAASSLLLGSPGGSSILQYNPPSYPKMAALCATYILLLALANFYNWSRSSAGVSSKGRKLVTTRFFRGAPVIVERL
jgi:hypothetical protein